MNIFEEAAALKKANRVFAIAMITQSKGSTPRSSARMLVRDDRSIVGTIGGGPVELYVIEQALSAMKERTNRTCSYTLKMKEKEGMHCGGEMSFFIDVEVPGTALLLVGAGHVNRAVAKAAIASGFSVQVVDNREVLLKKEFFPPEVSLYYGATLQEAVNQSELNENSFVLVATGSEDTEGLRVVMGSKPRFLGMLGSRRKAIKVREELLDEGWDKEVINKVICPIGLNLGAESPSEIAVSILGQMIMFKTGFDGREIYRADRMNRLIIVRGAGDIATGSIARLHNAGYAVLALETEAPTVIRRTVAFAEAVHSGSVEVEGLTARLTSSAEEIEKVILSGEIAIAVDPEGALIDQLKPVALIDAILAKKNLGTKINHAPLTIALGPGFEAGRDIHYIVETSRGHDLGKIITIGPAKANTGIPGNIEGFTEERIIRAPAAGKVTILKDISSLVKKGDIIARVGDTSVEASIDGMIRGMIREGTEVHAQMKMGDIDPRGEKAQYKTISDKARAIGGSVLEILLRKSLCP